MSLYEFSRPLDVDMIDRHGKRQVIAATDDESQALAKRFDLLSLQDLKAELSVMPHAGGTKYEVTGQITAKVVQESVISGKPVETMIRQDVSAWYADETRIASFEKAKKQRDRSDIEEEHEIKTEEQEPETVTNGAIDLGEVAAQFLGLALDDFPRSEDENEGAGDHIEVNPDETRDNPFAKLAQLKDKQ